eukprot:SAG31_NODE_12466_length_939_cov_3.211905_1_plen_69_part_01
MEDAVRMAQVIGSRYCRTVGKSECGRTPNHLEGSASVIFVRIHLDESWLIWPLAFVNLFRNLIPNSKRS